MYFGGGGGGGGHFFMVVFSNSPYKSGIYLFSEII